MRNIRQMMVEIEVFSFCNRTCWFCPNSFIDRKSTNNYMPEDVYIKLLRELDSFGYHGLISYSRYNEPFADDVIFTRVKQAKEIVPDARLHTNTNGDYLNHEKLLEAEESGFTSLNIQLYPSKDYSREETLRMYEKTQNRCKIEGMTLTKDEPDWVEWNGKVGRMNVAMYGRDFMVNGTCRGGQIEPLVREVRVSACSIPANAAYIDWNGNVMPCCNLRSDIKDHEWYILGNINESSLIDCLESQHACDFRREVGAHGPKKGACATCTM